MILRVLNEPGTTRPAPLVRLVALLLVLGMVGITGPAVVMPLLSWVLSLL